MKGITSIIFAFFGFAIVSFAQSSADEIRKWKKDAVKGYAYAQYNLGVIYANGDGVPEDDIEAVKWYRKAAEQGDADAQYNLGYMYSKGEGVPEDDTEAVKWYRKAAEQGDADAQCYLGFMYDDGEGVPEDDTEAVKWYRKATEQGNARAQNNLGFMYHYGDGVQKDLSEASKWYRRAAVQGNPVAQYNLGEMYDNGEGVTKNINNASYWYRKAAEQGDEDARKRLEELVKERALVETKNTVRSEEILGEERALVEASNTARPEEILGKESKESLGIYSLLTAYAIIIFVSYYAWKAYFKEDNSTTTSCDESKQSEVNDTSQEEIKVTADQKININSATVEDLITIPGVGNVAANAIFNNRPFSNFSEILSLDGVGPALVKKLQEWCTIEHPSLTLIKTYEESLYDATHDEKIVLLTVSIASLMAHADHRIVPNESKVIKKWRDQALERVGANVNSNAQLKRGFNASTQLLKAGHFKDRFIDNVCGIFESSSVQREKNAMLELCFQVMVADNYLHINEAKIINEFSNRCGISRKQLNDYRDKLILEERLVFDATVPLDVFYGINFSEDVESSKKFLMDEFRKWNMRINTLGPMKREGAQRMIDRISDARKRLK
jgi:TPR repeat protein